MSLGGSYSAAENAAVDNLVAQGVVVVAAAGNSAADACYESPASATSAITVGSTDESDQLSGFSNWGACVDIFAPGVLLHGPQSAACLPLHASIRSSRV